MSRNKIRVASIIVVILFFASSFSPICAKETPVDLTVCEAAQIEWDDCDSHRWIGESWGSNKPSGLAWGNYHGRNCLEIRWDYPAWLGYIRTDAFSDEDWESPVIGLRADVYVESSERLTDIGIEPRDHLDKKIELLFGNARNLIPYQWHTVYWSFNPAKDSAKDYKSVTGLLFKLDQLGNCNARVYIDNLKLITDIGDEEWDDMDDPSHWWIYGGNWYNWAYRDYGLEAITHTQASSTSPAGSMFLQWDYNKGEGGTSKYAEIATPLVMFDDDWSLNEDWSRYNRISADVMISNANVPINIFLWDNDTKKGFSTPFRMVERANTWQTLVWDIPWPVWFDKSSVDQVKFVVTDIEAHQTGTLYIDNIVLKYDPLPDPIPETVGLYYVFDDFNDKEMAFNDFCGNWGKLNSDYINASIVTDVYRGDRGASLRLDYNLSEGDFTGIWESMRGHSDYPEYYLNFTDIYGKLEGEHNDFEQIRFWVRGSGTSNKIYNVKVELKDNREKDERFNYTAIKYIKVDDNNTNWKEIVLDANLTNSSFWSYNKHKPDLGRMKELLFVLESPFNDISGTFYIDDIRFVDADDEPFNLSEHTDDEFLDFIEKKTFLYFLDWVNEDNGLILERSTYPDLVSIAATGFGLTALCIGAERGWIDSDTAHDKALTTIQTFNDIVDKQKEDPSVYGKWGFFYHFMNPNGTREESSELSSVDSAILIAGALTAGEYFGGDVKEDAQKLYESVQWEKFLYAKDRWPGYSYPKYHNQFFSAWKPGSEYESSPYIDEDCDGRFSNRFWDKDNSNEPFTWDYYTDEVILINTLAITSPTYPVPPETFYAWQRDWGEYGGHHLIQSHPGSLFTYFFAHIWIDFEKYGYDNHPDPTKRVNWWNNSVEATLANWQFCVDHHDDDATCDEDDNHTTYGECSWGLTACEGPDGAYHAYGAKPCGMREPDHDGTIAPYGAGSSIVFTPNLSISALRYYFENTDLWRYRFGFGDAYSLDPPICDDSWCNHVYFGIDQGPMLIMIENYRSRLIWKTLDLIPPFSVFDTGNGTYPSIFGTHNGTNKPSHGITVNEMYTYPCIGTGGHSEYVRIYNETGTLAVGY